jgi:hypothetical protein
MQSKATTVNEYLETLPADRRAVIEAVRAVLRKNLDKDIVEGMSYGMIGYAIPHRVYPPGYHCDPKAPLPFAGLASQKNHMSLYLMCAYGNSDIETKFRKAWAATGKKLDMGKACVRFKKLDDVALDVVAATIRSVTAKAYIKQYETLLATPKPAKAAAARPTKKVSKDAASKTVTPKARDPKASATKSRKRPSSRSASR